MYKYEFSDSVQFYFLTRGNFNISNKAVNIASPVLCINFRIHCLVSLIQTPRMVSQKYVCIVYNFINEEPWNVPHTAFTWR